MNQSLISQIERAIRRDPGRRGLIAAEAQWGPLCAGHLGQAAAHLAEEAEATAIVTGFFVPGGTPPAAETDGPPGALLLAHALAAVGREVVVLTDSDCLSAVCAAAEVFAFPLENVFAFPRPQALGWSEEFFCDGPGKRLTHLISVERVGPSHTPQSLAVQQRSGDAPLLQFAEHVAAEFHDRCHNMHGQCVTRHAAELHLLFEQLRRFRPGAKSIGVGDGGNEIGMGSIPWEELHRRLPDPHGGRVACRIATDWTIVAGTSNWGGAALAAAVLAYCRRTELLAPFDRDHEQRVIEAMVERGPAVDGITGRREATVDGLPFLTYVQPWESIRRALGLAD